MTNALLPLPPKITNWLIDNLIALSHNLAKKLLCVAGRLENFTLVWLKHVRRSNFCNQRSNAGILPIVWQPPEEPYFSVSHLLVAGTPRVELVSVCAFMFCLPPLLSPFISFPQSPRSVTKGGRNSLEEGQVSKEIEGGTFQNDWTLHLSPNSAVKFKLPARDSNM